MRPVRSNMLLAVGLAVLAVSFFSSSADSAPGELPASPAGPVADTELPGEGASGAGGGECRLVGVFGQDMSMVRSLRTFQYRVSRLVTELVSDRPAVERLVGVGSTRLDRAVAFSRVETCAVTVAARPIRAHAP